MAGERTVKITILGDEKRGVAALKATESAAGGLESKLGGLGGVVSKTGGLIGSVLGGLAITGGAAVVGLGGLAVKAGVDFNSMYQQAEIGFTTMLGSAEKAESFLQELAAFAAKTPFEFPELIGAAQKLKAMGFEAEDVIPTLTDIGNAVAAMGGNAEMVDRVTTAFGQMQAKGKASAEEMGQLTEAGIPGWKYLAEAIGTDVPTAMKMVEQGAVSAETVIGAVRAGIQRDFGGMMEAQSNSFAGLLSTIKDTYSQAAGKVMKPLFDALTRGAGTLATAMGGAGFQDLVAKMAAGMGVAVAAIEAWGPRVVSGLMAGGAAVAGFASSVMAAMPAVIGTFNQLKALITEGDFIGGGIFAEDSPLVTGILAIREGFERLRGILAQIPAPVLAAVAGFVGLGPALTVVAAVLPTLIGAFTGLGPIISILTSTLPLLGSVIAAIGWPITAVVVAVGLLAAAWTTNFMGIRDITMPIIQQIGGFITGVFLPALTSIGTTLLTAVMPYVQQFIGFLTGQLLPGIQGIVAVAIPAFQQFAAALMGAFQAALPGIQAFIGGMVALGAAVLPIIAQVAAVIIDSLGPAIMAIVEWAQTVIPQLGAAWENVLSIIGPVVGAIASFIGDTLTTIAGAISSHSDTIVSVLQGAWDVISGVIGVAWALISGIISTGLQVLSGDWTGAWNTIKATAQTVWDGIQQIISGAWTAITGVVSLAIAGVTTALATAWASISSAATTGWESVKSAISTAWENIKTAVTNGISSVVTLMQGLPGQAVSAVGNLGTLLFNAGASLLEGLISGIKSKLGELQNALGSITDLIPDWKGPPEKDAMLLFGSGQLIMDGLINGIDSKRGALQGLLGDVTSQIGAAFTSQGGAMMGGGGVAYDPNLDTAARGNNNYQVNNQGESGKDRIARWTADHMREYGMSENDAYYSALARLKRDEERTNMDWRRSGFDLSNIRALDTEKPVAGRSYGPGGGPQGAVWRNTGNDRWEMVGGGGAGAGAGAVTIQINAPVYGIEHFENMVAIATEQLYRQGRGR